jgi:hypothetical protein
LSHIGNAKPFEEIAKQFVSMEKPLASKTAKEFAGVRSISNP